MPLPHLPAITPALLLQVLPAALSFTLLGGVESLLSAKVADSMTGRKHRSNMELVAQGIANIASALFGGISVTGTIARTATNIRAGAQQPALGHPACRFPAAVHAGRGAAGQLRAAGGAGRRAGGGVLEHDGKAGVLAPAGHWREAVVLLATFALTLIKDLTYGIIMGCALAALFALVKRAVTEEGA